MSAPDSCAARNAARPVRPKPLIATRMVMVSPLSELTPKLDALGALAIGSSPKRHRGSRPMPCARPVETLGETRGGAMATTALERRPEALAPDETARRTMSAAVVHDFAEPLRVEEVPLPVAGAGEIVVRIEASGLCHTDIHAAHGDWPVKPTLPFTPGHEGIGVIEAVGPGDTGRQVGERVALAWLGSACGRCDYCISGWETLCEQQANTGYSINGGFAEYAVADGRYAVPVPEGVTA